MVEREKVADIVCSAMNMLWDGESEPFFPEDPKVEAVTEELFALFQKQETDFTWEYNK